MFFIKILVNRSKIGMLDRTASYNMIVALFIIIDGLCKPLGRCPTWAQSAGNCEVCPKMSFSVIYC